MDDEKINSRVSRDQKPPDGQVVAMVQTAVVWGGLRSGLRSAVGLLCYSNFHEKWKKISTDFHDFMVEIRYSVTGDHTYGGRIAITRRWRRRRRPLLAVNRRGLRRTAAHRQSAIPDCVLNSWYISIIGRLLKFIKKSSEILPRVFATTYNRTSWHLQAISVFLCFFIFYFFISERILIFFLLFANHFFTKTPIFTCNTYFFREHIGSIYYM